MLSIPKKLPHIVRNKIKKESWQLVKKKKVIQNQKISKSFKKPKIFLSKGTKHKKNCIEGLNSKNKNIKDGGSPQWSKNEVF